MDRIRNEFDELQTRRRPTELLQNARDLACPDLPVRVQIELTDDAVCLRRSGGTYEAISRAIDEAIPARRDPGSDSRK